MPLSFQRSLCFLTLVTLPLAALAQDVNVTAPRWYDSASNSIPAPEFKHKPHYEYPEEFWDHSTMGYSIVVLGWTIEKEIGRVKVRSSNDSFQDSIFENLSEKALLKEPFEKGELAWYAVLFNPKGSNPKSATHGPSLKSVEPIIKGTKSDDPIWLTIHVDAQGKVSSFDFDNATQESSRQELQACLAKWEFNPAMKEGQAVEASVHLPVLSLPVSTSIVPDPNRYTKPVPVHQVEPDYPQNLLRYHMKGKVLVSFVINTKGQVEQAYALESTHPGFNKEAVDAVRKWTFKPATRDGIPVKTSLRVPLSFGIIGDPNDGEDYLHIPALSKAEQSKLPEKLRYDVPPRSKDVVIPYYPYELLKEKTQGSADVLVIIGKSGTVSDSKVMQASNPAFGEALAAALRSMHFSPALKDGKPTYSTLRMRCNFTLHDQVADAVVAGEEDLDAISIETNHPEKILAASALDKPLHPLGIKPPTIPEEFILQSGRVIVELIVDQDGQVCLPRLISAPTPELGGICLIAAKSWAFEPPRYQGKPAMARVRIPVDFSKEGKDSEEPHS